jgi:hypothetical protein
MSYQTTEFLVALPSETSRSISGSIRQVRNLSAGFCRSWASGDHVDAHMTSQEAFQFLDFIYNTLLRQRDDRKGMEGWTESGFKKTLDRVVGKLLKPASEVQKSTFLALAPGSGAMPRNVGLVDLTLEVALNKLKHHSSIKFSVSREGLHTLYIFTHASMQQPHTISQFDIEDFCIACKDAANTL